MSIAHTIKCYTNVLYLRLTNLSIYFTAARSAKYCDECLCLSVYVCLFACVKNLMSKHHDIFCVRGSVILWLQCKTLCTSGFVDDVTFAHNRSGKGDADRAYILKSDSLGQHQG